MAPDTRRPIIESFFRCLIFYFLRSELRLANQTPVIRTCLMWLNWDAVKSSLSCEWPWIISNCGLLDPWWIHNLHILSIIIIYLHNSEVRLGALHLFSSFVQFKPAALHSLCSSSCVESLASRGEVASGMSSKVMWWTSAAKKRHPTHMVQTWYRHVQTVTQYH